MFVTDGCTDACGWLAATLSCLAFGSFAVPIKGKAARSVDVDPLVFQSYKTFMCFMTSWFILLIPDRTLQITDNSDFGDDDGKEDANYYYQSYHHHRHMYNISFTPWGIVSGIFWVPAGVAAIYAVKHAGLAVSQGLWSSCIVLVSFTWGIFIFGENVRNVVNACLAIACMMIGLWGMSYYSHQHHYPQREEILGEDNSEKETFQNEYNHDCRDEGAVHLVDHPNLESKAGTHSQEALDHETDRIQINGLYSKVETKVHEDHDDKKSFSLVAYPISQRALGLLAAIFNGIWGGSIMAPMHFAPDDAKGLGYTISFAIGASIVTLSLWIIRYTYCLYLANFHFIQAYKSLPSLHLATMWLPGGIAGMLWSIGNISSMVSVQQLGVGVGYALTQASMLVSGLWGIFYFHEIKGLVVRIKWMLAAVITLFGILVLSYEHK